MKTSAETIKLTSPDVYISDTYRFPRYLAIAPGMTWAPIMDGTFGGDLPTQDRLRKMRAYVLGLCEAILRNGQVTMPDGTIIREINYAGAWEIFGRTNATAAWQAIPSGVAVPAVTY